MIGIRKLLYVFYKFNKKLINQPKILLFMSLDSF
jgi:hypothetical protein